MTEQDYNRLPGVRWSLLRQMAVSALQYRYTSEQAREDGAHFRLGRAVHCFVLEPEAFADRFVTYRESKAVGEGAKKRWQAFQADAEKAGKTVIDVAEHDAAVGMGLALLAYPVASRYLEGGLKEHAVTWTDPETGLACKARLDQCGSALVDIKSARDIGHRLFAAAAARHAYHGQAAFYLDGARASGIDLAGEPVLLVVQSSPPHDVVVYRLGDAVVTAGRDLYQRLLRQLKSCLDRDEWPGLAPDAPVDLVLPEWVYAGDPLELVMPDGEGIHV